MTEKFDPERWAGIVAGVLADQPELASATVRGMQAGLFAALDRQKDRALTLSLGLHEALRTERRAKTRRGDVIIAAIEASNLYGSPWATEAIAREQRTVPDSTDNGSD